MCPRCYEKKIKFFDFLNQFKAVMKKNISSRNMCICCPECGKKYTITDLSKTKRILLWSYSILVLVLFVLYLHSESNHWLERIFYNPEDSMWLTLVSLRIIEFIITQCVVLLLLIVGDIFLKWSCIKPSKL